MNRPANSRTPRLESGVLRLAFESGSDGKHPGDAGGCGVPAGDHRSHRQPEPTGLAVDAVEAAVRQDQDCVVAQVRKSGVAGTVLPALAGGHCLAGAAT
jgi:hypothetical protein